VVARYHGEGVARATARHIEYRYPDDNRRRVEVPAGFRPGGGGWWGLLIDLLSRSSLMAVSGVGIVGGLAGLGGVR
jgi:hypothetical protein